MPDGLLVAAVRTRRGAGIAVVSQGGAALRWIVGPSGGEDLSPVVSPDGSRIVYLRDQSVGNSSLRPRLVSTKLMSVPLRGGKPKVLATVMGGARWPSWDPSGSRLAFTALALKERDGSFFPGPHGALMEINADGTCLTDVYSAKHGGVVWGAAWRPGEGRGAGPISC